MHGPRTPNAARRSEARRLFGEDVAGYETGRLPYTERVYEILVERCGLTSGTRILEIGPGTGRATRRLSAMGGAVVGVEPDPALAAYLCEAIPGIEVLDVAFEDADFPEESFDLVVAATSFHWVDQDVGLSKLARLLRRGGYVALWWEMFGDSTRPDRFGDATEGLVPARGIESDGGPPYQLDIDGWRQVLTEKAGIDDLENEMIAGTARLDTRQLRALYASWSVFRRLPSSERDALLDQVEGVALSAFGGVVERPYVTAIYTGRRR